MNFLKKIWGYLARLSLLTWVLIAVIIFLVVKDCVNKYNFEKNARVQAPKIAPKTDIIEEAEEIARQVDTAGRERVVFKLAEPIIQRIQDNAKVDSLAKENGIQAKQITAITQINGTLEKQNTDLRRIVATLADGNKDTIFRYSDKWFSAEGFRKNDTIFSLRNITADISVNKIDHSRKKNWLIGRNENVSTVYFNSPYARVNGLSTMTIKQKETLVDFSVEPKIEFIFNEKINDLYIYPVNGGVRLGRFLLNGGVGFRYSTHSEFKKNPVYNLGVGWKLY